MHRWIWFGWIMVAGLCVGCGLLLPRPASIGQSRDYPLIRSAPDKVVVYVYRRANYQGGGRTHLLELDERTLGRLTGDNYYCIELWPGHYYLNVHLPGELFLGTSSAPMSIGQMMKFNYQDEGQVYLYIYEDGTGLRRQTADQQALADLAAQRTLGKALSADDTAHVRRFFDTRYDGPEIDGQPHGKGCLRWPDGSRYEGVFLHGQLTPEGRFYFADGNIYMGRLNKARPEGAGALFSSSGRVLYAGPFSDEKPHGIGIRTGEEGPEYCTYEQGTDVTISFFQLAQEMVVRQERQEIEQFLAYCPFAETLEADLAFVALYNRVYQELLEQLDQTRPFRISEAYRTLFEDHQARIATERTWCQEEFSQDRDWCICAPFDAQAGQWQACEW